MSSHLQTGNNWWGGAVLIPNPGGEPTLSGQDTQAELFSFFSGDLTVQLTGEYAGYADRIKFGYYTKDPDSGVKILDQIFDGPDYASAIGYFTVNPGEIVGFYFTTPQGPGYTYYSEKNSNPDNFGHIRVFQNESLRKITLGCEDLYGGGDRDFQDFMVTILY